MWRPGWQGSGIACHRPLCLSQTAFDLCLDRSSTQFTKVQILELLPWKCASCSGTGCWACLLQLQGICAHVTTWDTWSCAFRGWGPTFPAQCCHSNILGKVVVLYFAASVGLRQVAAGIPPGSVHSLT